MIAARPRHHLVRAGLSRRRTPFPGTSSARSPRSCSASRDGGVLQYGPTRGYRPLLETIAAIMERRGIATKLEDLLVTTGSQQGLDLVARVLVDPGDVVLVELPTYIGAITAFRNVQAQLVGVPQEADGDRSRRARRDLRAAARDGRRVKFLYVVPNFQNPTGLLIGLDKRAAAARVGGAPRRPDRRGRSVPRAVFRGLGDGGRGAADQGRRSRAGASCI